MRTLGDYLKQSRESRNISLSDVAEYTKISKLYLDCLEKNDFNNIKSIHTSNRAMILIDHYKMQHKDIQTNKHYFEELKDKTYQNLHLNAVCL